MTAVGKHPVRMFSVLAFMIILSGTITPAHTLEISNIPLDLIVEKAPPNLFFVVDTSAIADGELLTTDSNGLFEDLLYVFPESAYLPTHDHAVGGKTLSGTQRHHWRTQFHLYNRLFYNPLREYPPWPSTQRFEFQNADLNNPFSNPIKSGSTDSRVDLAAQFFTIKLGEALLVIPVAHYFSYLDANGNSRFDAGEEIYLVTWTDANSDNRLDTSNSLSDQRSYYRFLDDGDQLVEDDELHPVSSEEQKNRIRPAWYDETGQFVRYKSDREDLQNFANWFSYYRRRAFVLKAAVAHVITGLRQTQVGICASNGAMCLPMQPVKVVNAPESGTSLDQTQTVLNALYALPCGGTNQLRETLDQVGRYLHQQKQSQIGDTPFWPLSSGGACQYSSAVILAASYWDDTFSGLGNTDGNSGLPFSDQWEDTLGDIAMHYYESDLAPELPDLQPSLFCDTPVHQHLVTYAVSFGVAGTSSLNVFNAGDNSTIPGITPDPCSSNEAHVPDWPFPTPGGPGTIDDLWHAAVNGRGLYAHATEPRELWSILEKFVDHFDRRLSMAAAASGYSTTTYGATAYQAIYNSEDWSGDVIAFPVNHLSGKRDGPQETVLWHAEEQLQGIHDVWDRRRIITYGGSLGQPQGIPFRYELLSDKQRADLGSDLVNGSVADQKARHLLEYLRGRADPEFRVRLHLLGDIVHSVPIEVEGIVFVGSNDGMMHAFDAITGNERFSYVPNLVMDQLHYLGANDYTGLHRYYVDGPICVGEVLIDEFRREMLLVGGLGKGGRGYYCMRIGSRRRPPSGNNSAPYEPLFTIGELSAAHSESDFAEMVLWEYPGPALEEDGIDNNSNGIIDEDGETDPDMGYSYSKAYAVNANFLQNRFQPVVIFGNGYNSSNGHAVLYIIDALTGRIIRKIDTGVADDNGMSTPALIDVNLDRRVDYAFAGDLKGNLWKFDLTAPDPKQWGVAYGKDRNGNGIIDAAQGDEPAPLINTSGQPITGRPDVMRLRSICAAQAPGFLVVFGTGRYLDVTDRSDFNQQSIYGIWDYGDDSDDSEHLGSVSTSGRLSNGLVLLRRKIIGEKIIEGETVRQLSEEQIDYSLVEDNADDDDNAANNRGAKREMNPQSYAGWILDFAIPPDPLAYPGERVITDALIRGGRLILSSVAPLDEPCRTGSLSWVYFLDGCSGNPAKDLAGELILPWRHDSMIRDIRVRRSDDKFALDEITITDQTGNIVQKELIGEKWGRIYWRQN